MHHHPDTKKPGMTCPACGSTDLYRSRRRWHERLFNWLLWPHQRPYRCSMCRARFWVSRPARAWRYTVSFRLHRMTGRLHWYIGVMLLILLTAWLVNALHA